MARLLLVLLALLAAPAAMADPADIAAAGRGVVRVVLVAKESDSVQYVGHGSGFAVAPNLIVTNAHVVAEARDNDSLLIGVVPSEGSSGYVARIVAFSPRNDLALLRLVDKGSVPALALYPGAVDDGTEVFAVGYPGNVDLAQGLSLSEIVEPQTAVKSRGYLSAGRSSRQFDTLLHSAPVGTGNSGGPLLDACGRVIGVNSFGTLSEGSDSEFYFAVSMRELSGFLRGAGVTPRLAAMPCRSLAELDKAERERLAGEQAQNEAQARALAAASAEARETARRDATFAILEERENGMALALVLLMAALAASIAAYTFHDRNESTRARIALGFAAALALTALIAWLLRPPFSAIDERASASLSQAAQANDSPERGEQGAGPMVCVFDPSRSRATVSDAADVPFEWRDDGCVNRRTQYGLAGNGWSRILVPGDEPTVSVNSYDPKTRTYRVDRYLLSLEAMTAARAARGRLPAPACGVGEQAARDFGAGQQAITALLPPQPNERLVYSCQKR